MGAMRKRETFTLTHDATGQSIRAIVISKTSGGRFMKVWQDTGWGPRLDKLQGRSLRVLWQLVEVAGWQNEVPGPSDTARALGMRQPAVSRAYGELLRGSFLHKVGRVYRLSPFFCWKGNDQQLEEVIKQLAAPGQRELVGSV